MWPPVISSINFSECLVYICDFHREQAWERWTKTVSHGVNKDEVLPKLRRIASSSTQEAYDLAVDDLKSSEIWNSNILFKKWFANKWLAK